jgi:hypothetical protein
MANFVVGFVMLCVTVCSAIAFFDQNKQRKRFFHAGLGFGTFALLYLAGNSLGVKGSIWYFLHLNVLLMLLLTDGITNGEYYSDVPMSLLIWYGHRIVGTLFVVAFLAHTRRSTWVLLDYVIGTYLASCAWKCFKKVRSLPVLLRQKEDRQS